MRSEIIKKTDDYIVSELMKIAGFEGHIQREAEYRIEHSRRVARIAAEIARAEGFDEEQAYIAGLLHDIGYSIEYKKHEDFIHHGRYGASFARPFLEKLGYSKETVEEMCYGIAIHVDGRADFEGTETKLAVSVGDADNIDRFDAYRLYESLQMADYKNLPIAKQYEFLNGRLDKLAKLRSVPFGTATAQTMWEEKIDFQIEFLTKLRSQAENGMKQW